MEIQAGLVEQILNCQEKLDTIKQEIAKIIVGQQQLINFLLIGIFADGHILLEGVPGVAKTLAANTLATIMACNFKRVQFTPDLLPADLIGTSIYNNKEGNFFVKKGPIFTQFLLADEINRAPAKVQSALLEVMQERQVTISGETFKIAPPFIVLATQNPIEQEGTYPLAEAQVDRFMMKIKIDYPTRQEEKKILQRMGTSKQIPQVQAVISIDEIFAFRSFVDAVYIDDKIVEYILDIILATRNPEAFKVDIQGLLDYGVSPRASLALKMTSKAHAFINGRHFVTPQDVKTVCYPVLRHRLKLSYEAEAENLSADEIITRILDTITMP